MRPRRLLLTGILLCTLPFPAAARSDLCLSIAPSMTPVSSYTARVLARAERGINFARAQEGANSEDGASLIRLLPGWAEVIAAAGASLMDTHVRIVLQAQSLRAQSACLFVDVFLLQCAMESVQERMQEALVDHSWIGIWMLDDLLVFLNTRLRHLIEGAKDPAHEDPEWHRNYSFDPPGSEYGDPVGPESFAMCPFHSDYLPPSIEGYGCDAEVLTRGDSNRMALPSVREEGYALLDLKSDIDGQRLLARTSLEKLRGILRLLSIEQGDGQTLSALFPAWRNDLPGRVHRTFAGCGNLGGVCANKQTVACNADSDCVTHGGGSCIPYGRCDASESASCLSDNDCPTKGEHCARPQELLTEELRGAFSLERDEVRLMNRFRLFSEERGLRREQSDMLKMSEEFPANAVAQRKEREASGWIIDEQRGLLRAWFQQWNREQAAHDAGGFAESTDNALRSREALRGLRGAMKQLAQTIGAREGLRSFLVRFAYFLRRSCLHRPCNLWLEQVMKIGLTDSCFPYANGSFLGDGMGTPRWEQCMQDAGL